MTYNPTITDKDKTTVIWKLTHYNAPESRAMNTMRKAHAIRRKIASIYGADALDSNVKLQGRLF